MIALLLAAAVPAMVATEQLETKSRYLLVMRPWSGCLKQDGDSVVLLPAADCADETVWFKGMGELLDYMNPPEYKAGGWRYAGRECGNVVGIFDMHAAKRLPFRCETTHHPETEKVIDKSWDAIELRLDKGKP